MRLVSLSPVLHWWCVALVPAVIAVQATSARQSNARGDPVYREALAAASAHLALGEFRAAATKLDAVRPTRPWPEWSALSGCAAMGSRVGWPAQSIPPGRLVMCLANAVRSVRIEKDAILVIDSRGNGLQLSCWDAVPSTRTESSPRLRRAVGFGPLDHLQLRSNEVDRFLRSEPAAAGLEPRDGANPIGHAVHSGLVARLAVVRSNGHLDLVDTSPGVVVARHLFESERISAVEFTRSGEHLLVARADGVLELRRSLDGSLAASGSVGAGPPAKLIAGMGDTVAFTGGAGGLIHRWEFSPASAGARGALNATLVGGRPSAIVDLCYLAELETLAAASGDPGVMLFDSVNGGALLQLRTRVGLRPTCMTASVEKSVLIAGFDNGSLSVWGLSRAAVSLHQLGAIRVSIADEFVRSARIKGVVRAEYEAALREQTKGASLIRLACAGGVLGSLWQDADAIAAHLERRLLDGKPWTVEEKRVLLDDAEWLANWDDDQVRANCRVAMATSRIGDVDAALARLWTVPDGVVWDGHSDLRRAELDLAQAYIELEAGRMRAAHHSVGSVPSEWAEHPDGFVRSMYASVTSRLQ